LIHSFITLFSHARSFYSLTLISIEHEAAKQLALNELMAKFAQNTAKKDSSETYVHDV